MHLIRQSVHIPPYSNSAMKRNNGTNRILNDDIAAETITKPPPCFTVGTQAFRIVDFLGVLLTQALPGVGNSVKDDSSDHITRAFPVV
jgi:hypothetical protein